LHEPFARYLIDALCRSNRRAEALSVYETYRGRLAREPGLEPEGRLHNLRRAILQPQAPVLGTPQARDVLLPGPPRAGGDRLVDQHRQRVD
jgi:DNA-binding SARP family transcriptional activator